MASFDVKKYFGASGLTVEVDKTQSDFHTLMLEIAPAMPGGKREFNWNEKIVIQLMERELPVFIAVLMGWRQNAKWDYRGSDHNKSIEIQHQATKVYIKICQAGTCHAIALPDHSVFSLSAFALRQLRRNYAGLNDDTLMMLIGNTIGRMGTENSNA